MQIEYDYYPADNGAIIHTPELGMLDVVQAGNDNRKFVGANYFGKSIIGEIEQIISTADKTEGVLIGVKVKMEMQPIYRKE
jgi:hypothetical protein